MASVILDVVVGGNTAVKGPDHITKPMKFSGMVGGKCGSSVCQCRRFDWEGRKEAATIEHKAKAKADGKKKGRGNLRP